jgi:hypothetical protein
MKISELIKQLNEFSNNFKDCDVEFLEYDEDDRHDPIEMELDEIHEGYTLDGVVCELRLKEFS